MTENKLLGAGLFLAVLIAFSAVLLGEELIAFDSSAEYMINNFRLSASEFAIRFRIMSI